MRTGPCVPRSVAAPAAPVVAARRRWCVLRPPERPRVAHLFVVVPSGMDAIHVRPGVGLTPLPCGRTRKACDSLARPSSPPPPRERRLACPARQPARLVRYREHHVRERACHAQRRVRRGTGRRLAHRPEAIAARSARPRARPYGRGSPALPDSGRQLTQVVVAAPLGVATPHPRA